jgi:hypothetical protein
MRPPGRRGQGAASCGAVHVSASSAESIDWIQADGNYARLHTATGSHLNRMSQHRRTCLSLLAATASVLLAAACHQGQAQPCLRASGGTAPQRADTGTRGQRFGTVTLRFDYAGAEALLQALERDSLTDANVDSLLRAEGVRRMVDNVTYYIPALGRTEFRRAIQRFVRTRRTAAEDRPFELDQTWARRGQIRALLDSTRRNERAVLAQTLADVAPYRPATGPLDLTVFLVAGGVSTGFAPPGQAAFYANLTRLEGDYVGLLWNVRHEAYHVMQHAALRRLPELAPVVDAYDSLPVTERLLATVLLEGTAELVTDPTCTTARGPAIDRARDRVRRNMAPNRLRENFALFDTLLRQLPAGQVSWREAYRQGFADEARLYAVGYAMAREIERHCGAACVGRLFERAPVEFFREYIRLYRAHPQMVGRFAPATERLLGADP